MKRLQPVVPVRSGNQICGMALPARGLVALLVAGGVVGSAAVMLDGPPHLRPARVTLPGFTAEEASGQLVVTSVRDGSGAALAGVSPGDVVETIDGARIHRLQDAAQFLTKHPHVPVRVGLVHAARHHDVMIGKREH